jgi:type IV pilus assembly protein PilW
MKSRTSIRRARGFSLVELMISVVIGLLVVAAAITVFASNSRTYTATESLGRIQENLRVAFELMGRDIREAGGSACGSELKVMNVLKNGSTAWYADFGSSVRGYDENQPFSNMADAPARVSGTDAIELKSMSDSQTNIVSHNPNSAILTVSGADHGLVAGDIAIICDFAQITVFKAANAANATINHNANQGDPTGNCYKGLGYSDPPLPCNNSTDGTPYTFGCANGDGGNNGNNCVDGKWPAFLSKLQAVRWYVGVNGNGGNSLYRASLGNGGVISAAEIIDGVTTLQMTYLVRGASIYVPASSVTSADWSQGNVQAVSIDLQLAGTDRVGSGNSVFKRSMQVVVTIRNHVQ